MIDRNGEPTVISLQELLSLTEGNANTNITITNYDPFDFAMVLPSNPPIPEVHYYISDHLGNTRLTYSTDVTCSGAVTYTIDAVVDYFPYAKVLRQYANGEQEKYLSTQHQRDVETGLDYRGARFYDSDVGRFLSLDPLAAEYPSLSDYCYVAGNPVAYIDPTGKYFVGADGERVEYKVEEGTIVLGDGATDDLKELVKRINASGNYRAKKTFFDIANNKSQVEIVLHKNFERSPGGGFRYGLHKVANEKGDILEWNRGALVGGDADIKTDKETGELYYGKAQLNIYIGTHAEGPGLEYKRKDYTDQVLTSDEAIIGTFIHEGYHNLDQEAIQHILDFQKGTVGIGDYEAAPNLLQRRYHDELKIERHLEAPLPLIQISSVSPSSN